MILTAGYILWTLQRVFLGRSEQYKGLPDLNLREMDHRHPPGRLDRRPGRLPAVAAAELDGPVGRRDGPLDRRRHRQTADAAKPATPAKVLIEGIAAPVAQAR